MSRLVNAAGAESSPSPSPARSPPISPEPMLFSKPPAPLPKITAIGARGFSLPSCGGEGRPALPSLGAGGGGEAAPTIHPYIRCPMLFSNPPAPLPKTTAPTAAEIAAKSKPSPQGQALLKPGMTPPEYLHTLEKNKLSVDSLH